MRDRDETDTRLGQNFETENETESKLVPVFETEKSVTWYFRDRDETETRFGQIFETETRPRVLKNDFPRPRKL